MNWRNTVSKDFLEAAEIRLQRSRENRDECRKLQREVRGECLAIECRATRASAVRGMTWGKARTLARNESTAWQWAEAIGNELERIARDAEMRVKRWAL